MISRDLRKDRNGGIEGLPLQLMIVILVATMGTAIIVGWMGSIETPHSIGNVEVQDVVLCDDGTVTGFCLEVRDQDETAPVALTDENGKAVFGTLTVSPPQGTSHFDLHIVISKTDYGEKSVEVPVVLV